MYLPSRRRRFDPWVGKTPWRRKWQPTPVFLPGKSHGQRSWVGDVHRVAKSWTWLSRHPLWVYWAGASQLHGTFFPCSQRPSRAGSAMGPIVQKRNRGLKMSTCLRNHRWKWLELRFQSFFLLDFKARYYIVLHVTYTAAMNCMFARARPRAKALGKGMFINQDWNPNPQSLLTSGHMAYWISWPFSAFAFWFILVRAEINTVMWLTHLLPAK